MKSEVAQGSGKTGFGTTWTWAGVLAATLGIYVILGKSLLSLILRSSFIKWLGVGRQGVGRLM